MVMASGTSSVPEPNSAKACSTAPAALSSGAIGDGSTSARSNFSPRTRSRIWYAPSSLPGSIRCVTTKLPLISTKKPATAIKIFQRRLIILFSSL